MNLALNEKKAEVRVQYKPVNGDIYPAGELKRYEHFLHCPTTAEESSYLLQTLKWWRGLELFAEQNV